MRPEDEPGAGPWPEAAPGLIRAAAASLGPEGDDAQAIETLLPQIYDRLRQVARGFLARERRGHTLSPTSLVHEAYLRLLEQPGVTWRGREHVIALAAHMMRRVLVNHAVARGRHKRGRGWERVTIDTGLAVAGARREPRELELLEVHEALERLARLDALQARLVELRFFAGMTIEEIAEVLGISPTTAKREWATARLWLLRELVPVEAP